MAEGKIFDAVTGVEHQSKSSLGNDCADARLLFFCLFLHWVKSHKNIVNF